MEKIRVMEKLSVIGKIGRKWKNAGSGEWKSVISAQKTVIITLGHIFNPLKLSPKY